MWERVCSGLVALILLASFVLACISLVKEGLGGIIYIPLLGMLMFAIVFFSMFALGNIKC